MTLTGAQGVGKCVKEMCVARGERTDDQIGHGFLRDTGCLERPRSELRNHAGMLEEGALERCEPHGTRLLPFISGRGATRYVIFRGSVHGFLLSLEGRVSREEARRSQWPTGPYY